jgi:hypothetical protein
MQKSNCQIEYKDSGSAVTFRCGRYSVSECADCGKSICSDCRTEGCGDSFCGLCFDYHLTHYHYKDARKRPAHSHRNAA